MLVSRKAVRGEGEAMKQSTDSARLARETYKSHFVYRTLYSDMDGFRHLNNGVVGRLFEEGRAEMNMAAFGTEILVDPGPGLQLLFARISTDYLRQARYPGEVEIATGVTRIGNSSWTVAQAAFQDGICFAVSETVTVKAAQGKAVGIAPDERAILERYLLEGQ